MENQLQIFSNDDFGEIRASVENGVTYFVGNDICAALGYEKARNAIAAHVAPEDALKRGILTNGGVQQMTLVNESGMYALISSVVLPDIRQTGANWSRRIVKSRNSKEKLPSLRLKPAPTTPLSTAKIYFRQGLRHEPDQIQPAP